MRVITLLPQVSMMMWIVKVKLLGKTIPNEKVKEDRENLYIEDEK